ncbi:hypothetical protein H4R22_003504 [Coemansia sp. RSA 1290]|nr:hypothetical protein H4R22_003504 [Coemansia sp. RSA 1290]
MSGSNRHSSATATAPNKHGDSRQPHQSCKTKTSTAAAAPLAEGSKGNITAYTSDKHPNQALAGTVVNGASASGNITFSSPTDAQHINSRLIAAMSGQQPHAHARRHQQQKQQQQRQMSMPAIHAAHQWSPPSHAVACGHQDSLGVGGGQLGAGAQRLVPSARMRASTLRVSAVTAAGAFSPPPPSLSVLSAVASSSRSHKPASKDSSHNGSIAGSSPPLHSSFTARHPSQRSAQSLLPLPHSFSSLPARDTASCHPAASLPTEAPAHMRPPMPGADPAGHRAAGLVQTQEGSRATPASSGQRATATAGSHASISSSAPARQHPRLQQLSTTQLQDSSQPQAVAAHADILAESANSASPADNGEHPSWVTRHNAQAPAAGPGHKRLQSNNGLAQTPLAVSTCFSAATTTNPSFSPSVTPHEASLSVTYTSPMPAKLPPSACRSSPAARALPPDHPVLVSMAKRNSIFYRRPKPPPSASHPNRRRRRASWAPSHLLYTSEAHSSACDPPFEDADCTCRDIGHHNSGYDPSSDEGECDSVDSDAAAAEEAEAALRYALCQALPFWHCYFTPDTHEFLWTTSPAIRVRPVTVQAQKDAKNDEPFTYYPPTPESVLSIVENLRMSYRNDICMAIIPFERRLPEIRDFIWRLFDATKVDLWTGIACLLLLKRFRSVQPPCDDAPYEAPYSLFLGVFMLATDQCVRSDNPELFTFESIARILDSFYQPKDLAQIKLDTFMKLDCRAWISLEDVTDHAAHNLFDVCNLGTSYRHYELRQRLRMQVEEEERRWEEDRQRLVARLERYMYRTPHDTLGSWNTEIMYCTESRFLFRHLPWSPGIVTPIHVTARSEQAKFYLNDGERGPVFSPLLPALRTRVSSSTN